MSGQLEGEIVASALGDVYTFGPTFRAEHSNTPRHAAEFWMIEPEIAFADLNDIMDLAEDFLKHLIRHLRAHCAEDLDLFARFVDTGLTAALDAMERETFVRLPYSEAVSILKAAPKSFEFPVEWGMDLQTEHERHLTEDHFHKPVIVFDYPSEIKAFYMRRNEDGKNRRGHGCPRPPGGRNHRRQPTRRTPGCPGTTHGRSRAEQRRLLVVPGTCAASARSPHSGFGMGFERFLMLATGITNIRDVIPFPRTPNNLEF